MWAMAEEMGMPANQDSSFSKRSGVEGNERRKKPRARTDSEFAHRFARDYFHIQHCLRSWVIAWSQN
jgi:hypothetical protein